MACFFWHKLNIAKKMQKIKMIIIDDVSSEVILIRYILEAYEFESPLCRVRGNVPSRTKYFCLINVDLQ